jgi:hypothetical protein
MTVDTIERELVGIGGFVNGHVVNRSVRHMNNYFCRKLLLLRQSLSDLKLRLRIPAFVSNEILVAQPDSPWHGAILRSGQQRLFFGLWQAFQQYASGHHTRFLRDIRDSRQGHLDHVTIHAASITRDAVKAGLA